MEEKLHQVPQHIDYRDYQRPCLEYMRNGGKRACLTWHRRAGKDLFSFSWLVEDALKNMGMYWYVLPYYVQAKSAMWDASTGDGKTKYIDIIPKDLIKNKNNQEMKLTLINDSIIKFVGGDKPDNLVGAGPRGIVISEWALQRPSLWSYLEPMLLANGGWVIFNSTPRGDNHHYDTHTYFSNNKDYFAQILTIDDTGLVTKEQIDEIRKQGRPEEIIQQEYYCSFAGAMTGSYYGDRINDAEKEKRITSVPYDRSGLVSTYWDLGVDDCTAIWFVQFFGREIRIIDYYEDNGKGLDHYAEKLLLLPYRYERHNLPHDGNHRQLGAGAKTIKQLLEDLGLNPIKVHDRTNDIYSDIGKVRGILSRCYFDQEKTSLGIKCLKNYRREYDEGRQTYKSQPLHDWSSHGADAFRLLAQSITSQDASSVRKTHIHKPTIAKMEFKW